MIEWGQEDKRGMSFFWLVPPELWRKPKELIKLGLDQEPKDPYLCVFQASFQL